MVNVTIDVNLDGISSDINKYWIDHLINTKGLSKDTNTLQGSNKTIRLRVLLPIFISEILYLCKWRDLNYQAPKNIIS